MLITIYSAFSLTTTELKRVKQLEKDISTIESKKSRLTDLLIDGKIEQKDYDEKKLSFQRKLHQITEEKAYLEENIGQQKNISKRMSQFRQTLENENATEKMCSSDGNVVGEMCAPADTDTYRDSCSFVPTETKAG